MSETTVESWMERIKELCAGYDCQNIWNIDESVCCFKVFPYKEMAKKGKKTKSGKKSKQRVAVTVFVSDDGEKVGKAEILDLFRKANAAVKRDQVSYFSNSRS